MDEQVRKGFILIKTFLFGTRQKQTQASLRGGGRKRLNCGKERENKLSNHIKGNFAVRLQDIVLTKGLGIAQTLTASFVSRTGNMLSHSSLVLHPVTFALKKD